jgi:hypothetical protein
MHTEDVQFKIMYWHMKRFVSYVCSEDLWSVAQLRTPQTPQLVGGGGDRNIHTKFVVGFFELDSIIPAEDSILESCYEIGE